MSSPHSDFLGNPQNVFFSYFLETPVEMVFLFLWFEFAYFVALKMELQGHIMLGMCYTTEL